MNLYNATPFAAQYSMGIQKSGRNCLVIVAKATYKLPRAHEEPTLADAQIPPFETDTYTGEPGFSAPIYENDFATFKPRCDVILHGSAYAPEPVPERIVGLKVGDQEKLFKVIGPRKYEKINADGSIQISPPAPFTQLKISYDTAYGGAEKTGAVDENGEELHDTFMPNPVGRGYTPCCPREALIGKPLPQTEELHRPIESRRSQDDLPQSFGPVARNWAPRYKLAGTYDQNWFDHVRPFLPEDFDEAYYQCAPPDQQVPHLRGGEVVALFGLTPEEKTRFTVPKVSVPMQAILRNGDRHNLSPVIDTLIIEPDENRFTLVWRARIAIRRSINEIDTLLVGTPTAGWERARLMDKPYVPLERLDEFKRKILKMRAEEERLRALNAEKSGYE